MTKHPRIVTPPARTAAKSSSRITAGAATLFAVLSACNKPEPPAATQQSEPEPARTQPAPAKPEEAAQGPSSVTKQAETPVTMPAVLEQGWNDELRDQFWFTGQGSQILPYDWFLVLEQPNGEELFRAAANIERLRYIPLPASRLNPDGLPLGFTKDVDAGTGMAHLGFTCAACHTAKLKLGGREVIIDGAPTLADFKTFLHEVNEALAQTQKEPQKFARFTSRVLSADASDAQKQTLRETLARVAAPLAAREQTDRTQVPYGYGRLDAFGGILNNVAVNDLKLPGNAAPPDAPVSYPHIWDAPRADRVQWNGAAFNAPVLGGLIRNIGEVLGVFGRLEFKADSSKGYDNSINLRNLGLIENWLKDLHSPGWPSNFLPPIDQTLAAKGKSLYGRQCASCHSVLDATKPSRTFRAVMVPTAQVQTDPTMASNYLHRMAETGILEGSRVMILSGPKFEKKARSFELVINGVSGIILRNPLLALQVGIEDLKRNKQLAKQSGADKLQVPADNTEPAALLTQLRSNLDLYIQQSKLFDAKTDAYKARPLNGIWATAPYLHNGSVPNLQELLKPAGERIKQFSVGSREFDPENVGLRTEAGAESSMLDTSQPGNRNTGHEYGTKLAVDEKRALIEYIKTL
jgi:mono/diheme cytochrome c family protein